jgi:non-canonical (house-cleaning) NTP pyrophosphatase
MLPTEGICQVVKDPVQGNGPFNLPNCKGIKIYVASNKQLKMNASKEAIQSLMQGYLQSVTMEVLGCHAAESNIKEQPVGVDETKKGAKNRIDNLRKQLHIKQVFASTESDDVLRIYVSMENGIIKEKLNGVKDKDLFETEDHMVWVDRCYIICEIYYNCHKKKVKGFSDGVTVPLEFVEASRNSDFNTTAGDFIAKKWDTNGTDWHLKLAGVSRKEIIKNGIVGILKNLDLH